MNEREIEWAERIAVLEEQIKQLTRSNKDMNDKLDSLLELKSKGVGAFWLASTLVGTGIVGMFSIVVDWFKG